MLTQPVPEVTSADVDRVVGRDFPSERAAVVHEILSGYGRESWQCGEDRVRLAALKLAAGDLGRLRAEIERATLDYHGVIAGAEYPGFTMKVGSCGLPTDDVHCEHAAHAKAVIKEDWRQYREWLER
jgi:hypothetical protein